MAILASDEGEREGGGERVLPRHSLVGDALRHRTQQEQERLLRLRRGSREVLPRRRRVPHHPIIVLGGLSRVEVRKTSL